MIYIIVHALAPIFVIMLLGFWAGKAGMVNNKDVSLLNIFVMDFALPAALFSAINHLYLRKNFLLTAMFIILNTATAPGRT